MILTETETEIVDNIVLNNLNKFIDKEFTLAELNYILFRNTTTSISYQTLHASLIRVLDRLKYRLMSKKTFGCRTIYYIDTKNYVFDGTFNKYKNILIIARSQSGQKDLTYDFITKSFSDDLRRVENLGSDYIEIIKHFLQYEWLFNFKETILATLLRLNRLDTEVYETCPKGFINFLEENNLKFDNPVLEEYYYKNKYGIRGYNLYRQLGKSNFSLLSKRNEISSFIKMLQNDVKQGIIPTLNRYDELFKVYSRAITINENIKLNENMGIRHNIKVFNSYIKEQSREKFENQMQKINFINGLVWDNLIAIVPQTIEDKIREGKLQHNCVGYYYDERIMRGEDFIFFIRKTDYPDNSYITCRYNMTHKSVVEYREKYNHIVTDKNALDFIEELSQIITNHYEQLLQKQKA